jgi:large subunit ribosomal protein L24
MTNKIQIHIKIGDKVKVLCGNQKGLIGTISSISKKNSTVIIDTITPRIKYVKNPQGGEATRVEIQLPLHISNVMLWDVASNKSSKIGYKVVDNKKVRFFKKSGNLV